MVGGLMIKILIDTSIIVAVITLLGWLLTELLRYYLQKMTYKQKREGENERTSGRD